MPWQTSYGRRRGNVWIGLIVAIVALISYYSSQEFNPLTGETQRVAISPDQEIALGLQAAPQMAQEYGGDDADPVAQARVQSIGKAIVSGSAAAQTDWRFQFHLLADSETINAFALPGGQVFITRGLYNLLNSDSQLAGVLAHEIGHVVARHGAEHIAKQNLAQGLSSAATVATGDYNAGQMAAMVGQLVNLRYGRGDELESDRLGVRLMSEAGYDPRAMIDVMTILAKHSSGGNTPDFFSTHPNPDNRIGNIKQAIEKQFPNGAPDSLKQ